MGRVRCDSLTLPIAVMGRENPLPFLQSLKELQDAAAPESPTDMDAGMKERMGYGRVTGGYPYSSQDSYTRDIHPSETRVAILENDKLRATFLLDYGGRLWSLVELVTGRELLFNPGKIQLANLGLTNAWFAGGVEWNIGTAGHSPFTCAPLHAAVVEGRNGEEVLRLYEYERLRGAVFQIDAWLPEGASFLKVFVRIHNPNNYDVPMWWWSNTAVVEAPDTRIVAPAQTAWYFGYDEGTVREVPVPDHHGSDMSYPGREKDAAEYFFRVAGKHRSWVAAVDGRGEGLVHTSTGQLKGRKLFRWGNGSGGRKWQTWLGQKDRAYCEIQAGITETQMEHMGLSAGQSLTWVEAYGRSSVKDAQILGSWDHARQSIETMLDAELPVEDLEQDLVDSVARADRKPSRQIHSGSGWGALEQLRRSVCAEPPMPATGTPFEAETMGQDQLDWHDLLITANMPSCFTRPPAHYVKGRGWKEVISTMPAGWLRSYLLGTLAHAENDLALARELYLASIDGRCTPWALRGVALLDLAQGCNGAAADHYLQAYGLAGGMLPLAIETVQSLLKAERADEALKVLETLKTPEFGGGRIEMLKAQALAGAGDVPAAAAIIDVGIVVADLREGETTLNALWELAYPGCPLPPAYDFQMRTTDVESPPSPRELSGSHGTDH